MPTLPNSLFASLLVTLGACDTPAPVARPSATTEEAPSGIDGSRSLVQTVTLPHPGGERPPLSAEERVAAQRALVQSMLERRAVERAGDAQALALAEAEDETRVAEMAATANGALLAAVPRIQACPDQPVPGDPGTGPMELSVLLDAEGLLDAWLLVDERTDLQESFSDCAASIIWEAEWPSSTTLRRVSVSLAADTKGP